MNVFPLIHSSCNGVSSLGKTEFVSFLSEQRIMVIHFEFPFILKFGVSFSLS